MLCWPCDDTPDFDILRRVGTAGCFDFIQQRLSQGSVLVNCFVGVNQSGAVVVGLLNQQLNQPLLETFSKVNKQRGKILTNYYFRRLLVNAAIANWKPI